ncbi:hypothetical protein [Anatilimnocola floriformis]|uniref:hypothetical protein n=1 Tax=Anatilimnocola floriformis TaxID=2948575 RepID=UPI0020C1FAF3|nr:hypothetical protein [Anatilimnocola floriformis]
MRVSDGNKSGLGRYARSRLTLGCLLSPLLLLLMVLLVAAIGCWMHLRRSHNELVQEIASVRETGRPLTTIDLELLYKPEPGLPDVTAELERVLRILDDKEVEDSLARVRKLGDALRTTPNREPTPELAEIERLLARFEQLLAFAPSLLDREFTTRFSYDLTLGFASSTPHAFRMLQGTQVLGLQLRVDLYCGRTSEAVNRLLQQLAMADTLGNDPNAIPQIVRLVIIRTAVTSLELLLGQQEVEEQDLTRLQSAFQKLDLRRSLQFTIRAERAMEYTCCTWPVESLAESDGDEKTRNRDFIEQNLARGPRYPWDAAVVLKSFRRLDEAAESSVHAVVREWNAVSDECRTRIKRAGRTYPYSSVLLPPFSITIKQFAMADAQGGAAIAAIAAARFRKRTQRWPATWQELVPEYLPVIPLDPFSGQEMLLRLSSESLKIYSVGENKQDESGSWQEGEFADVGVAIEVGKPE